MKTNGSARPSRLPCYLAGMLAMALAGSTAVNAAPVDVSYQISGSAGHWVLDFSVTNNMPSTGNQLVVYLFGVLINGSGHLDAPSDNWPIFFTPVSTNVLNGSGKTYTTNWLDYQYNTAIAYGQTLSGFKVSDPDLAVPTSVDWVAYGIGSNGANVNVVYTGPASDYIGPVNYNPGFEGTAHAVNSVPIPATVWLFAPALTGLALLRRRKVEGFNT